MTSTKRMTSAALGAAAVIGLGLSVLPARAAYVVDMMEVADPVLPHQTDVVARKRNHRLGRSVFRFWHFGYEPN